ncbi:hypothetical protein TWF679_005221 [Orbilia oligospora]|uniref:BTB domain-containing protein n=1 Tax=Orbilia oligospora TaxID=2813651 RepID=A0A8H8UPG0_ORBOL|nr:hypothetical protein TWF679_005221 [Orbilia oligospora]
MQRRQDGSVMAFKETPIYLYSNPGVILVVENSEIKAHEDTLASQSGYFKAVLHTEPREFRSLKRITIPGVTKNNMITVLNWLYRAPVESYYTRNLRGEQQPFSSETAHALKDIVKTFGFLQIKGAGRDYCKFMEQSLQERGVKCPRLGVEKPITQLTVENARSIVTQLNELYKSGGSISGSAINNIVDEIARRFRTGDVILREVIEVFGKLPDPHGKWFRHISVSYARNLDRQLG